MYYYNENGVETPTDAPPRRGIFGLIAAVIVGALGALAAVGNLGLLLHRMFGDSELPWSELPGILRFWEIELRAVAMLSGIIWLMAAVSFFRGRWKIGLPLAVAGLVVAIVNPMLNHALSAGTVAEIRPADDNTPADNAPIRILVKDTANNTTPSSQSPSKAPQSPSKLPEPARLTSPFSKVLAKLRQDEWAEYLQMKVTETNPLGMEFILIPPGNFKMGRSETMEQLEAMFPIIKANNANPDFKRSVETEFPVTKAAIKNAFYMAKSNVTVAQFRAFVNATGYQTDAEKNDRGGWGYAPDEEGKFVQKPGFNWHSTGFAQVDDAPVINVSFSDAVAFCEWITSNERKLYRPPTDVEWEYACRAGTTTLFSVGDDVDALLKAANVSDISYYTVLLGIKPEPAQLEQGRLMGMVVDGDDSYAFTSPVCKFEPNAFGLCDMHGNACTWCIDKGSPDPQSPMRIIRGGSWQYFPAFCRSAARFGFDPSDCQLTLGFRLVWDLTQTVGEGE